MTPKAENIEQLHWLLGILQNVDVGLVVLDRDYRIQLWNGFMENHSNTSSSHLLGKNIFEAFPEIPKEWLKRKVDSVFLLNNRAFTTWQQRPYLMKFSNYRPITSRVEWMYQNLTLFPLQSIDGSIDRVCMVITDVTESALDQIAMNQMNAELEQLSRTDGLTGLLNRHTWEKEVDMEFRRIFRSGRTSSLVMVDIDHFKKINDTYGHLAGDEVIRQISSVLMSTQRETDISGRYGGEEFGVLLLDTDGEGACYFSERLRAAVEGLVITSGDHEIRCTISIGIAEISEYLEVHEQWINQADKALYASKAGGRNRFTLFQE